MSKRVLSLLLVGAVALAGLALAQDPPAKDEPPARLKKKRPRGDDKPMVEPDEKKKDDKKDEKKQDKKAEAPEPEPVTPQEEEKEVFQRVIANVHKVGNRLAKSDLGEATQQTQRDILKDLDSLIRRNEEPPQGGGGQQDQNNGGGGGGDDQDNKGQQGGGGQGQKQQGSGQKAQGKSNGGGRNGGGGQNTQGKKGKGQSGAKAGAQQRRSEKNGGKGGEKVDGKNVKGGKGGGGNDKEDRTPNRAADQYKDIWGHLPQTLRAQMDAYSNPQPFLPKYDDLIKRYYRTIAEQGRRKGD